MDITKYSQFELYLLTLNLLTLKDQLVPDGCNPRCRNSNEKRIVKISRLKKKS